MHQPDCVQAIAAFLAFCAMITGWEGTGCVTVKACIALTTATSTLNIGPPGQPV
ncbi:MAG: hypothetical protein ACJ8F1_07750 [Polyangia bacterium]